MDLHDQFQERIQTEADPRLTQGVYADWLEEQGDFRATVLRQNLLLRDWPAWPALHNNWFPLGPSYPFPAECSGMPTQAFAEFHHWLVRSRAAAVFPAYGLRGSHWFWWEPVAGDANREQVLVSGRRVGLYDHRQLLTRLSDDDFLLIFGTPRGEQPRYYPLLLTRSRFLELLRNYPCGLTPTVPLENIPADV